MRAIVFVLLFIMGTINIINACGTHGLHSQSDVNNLICTGITNYVVIEQNTTTSDPITNLDSLITIGFIGSDLIIRNNPLLSDISISFAFVESDIQFFYLIFLHKIFNYDKVLMSINTNFGIHNSYPSHFYPMF